MFDEFEFDQLNLSSTPRRTPGAFDDSLHDISDLQSG